MPKLSFPTTELEMAREAREYLLENGGTEEELAANQRVIDKYTAAGRSEIAVSEARELPRGDGRSVTTGDIQKGLRKPADELDAGEGFGDAPQAAPVARKGTASPASQEYATKLVRQLWAMTVVGDPTPEAQQVVDDLVARISDMTQAKVSKLIDDSKAQIKKLEAMGRRAPQPDRLASDNQRALIRRLVTEKIAPVGELAARWEAVIGDAKLTFDEGGDLITELRAYPEREMVGEGMYRNPETGDVYKVQVAHHGSGKLYAKILVKLDEPEIKRGKEVSHGFEYVPGLLAQIQPGWAMTREQAAEWGHLYGACCRCGTVLTDEESIERGIGPVCADKF